MPQNVDKEDAAKFVFQHPFHFSKGYLPFTPKIALWAFRTYMKLLSEQIFLPLNETDDKSLMYAPFQCMAQYFLSKGYKGIIYRSTVYDSGRNIVLFDKQYASPVGDIRIDEPKFN